MNDEESPELMNYGKIQGECFPPMRCRLESLRRWLRMAHWPEQLEPVTGKLKIYR